MTMLLGKKISYTVVLRFEYFWSDLNHPVFEDIECCNIICAKMWTCIVTALDEKNASLQFHLAPLHMTVSWL